MPRTGEIIRDLTGQPILDLAGEYLRDLSDNVYLDFVSGRAVAGGVDAQVIAILNALAGGASVQGMLSNVSLDVILWASVGRASASGAHTLFIVIPSLRTANLTAGGPLSDVLVGLSFEIGESGVGTGHAEVSEIVNGGDGRALAQGSVFSQNWFIQASRESLQAAGWLAGVYPTVEVKLASLVLSTRSARVRVRVGHAAAGVRLPDDAVWLSRSTGDFAARATQVPDAV